MTEEQVKAVFLLAGLEVKELFKLQNEYWPQHSDFDDIRRENPWWLVKTEFGLIKIGLRKRVINIDWKDTGVYIDKNAKWEYEYHRCPITRDDVTSWEHGLHAWGYGKAVEYLTELKLRMNQHQYAISEEGVVELAKRKADYLAKNTKADSTKAS